VDKAGPAHNNFLQSTTTESTFNQKGNNNNSIAESKQKAAPEADRDSCHLAPRQSIMAEASTISANETIHRRLSPWPLDEGLSAFEASSTLELQKAACDLARDFHLEELRLSNIPDLSGNFPTFTQQEVVEGRILGKGGFGVVSEVQGFNLRNADKTEVEFQNADKPEETDDDPEDMESRQFISKHCIRNGGDARYAVKRLKPNVVANHTTLLQGIADMATETRLLSSLEHHPNIIKLRAIAEGDRFHKDYFIILDRVFDTLTERLGIWKKLNEKMKGIVGVVRDRKGEKKAILFEERIFFAYDLSSALAHLHKHGIIHRDLKPDNIGFDIVSGNEEDSSLSSDRNILAFCENLFLIDLSFCSEEI
jgi:hypothetical protein